MNEEAGFTIGEIGAKFGALISQPIANLIVQEKQIQALQAEIAILADENKKLREQLSQAELGVLKADGDRVIDEARVRPPA